MTTAVAAKQIALRILDAINRKEKPNDTDIDALRALAPFLSTSPEDGLASPVIPL
jgi:hypothetical protein